MTLSLEWLGTRFIWKSTNNDNDENDQNIRNTNVTRAKVRTTVPRYFLLAILHFLSTDFGVFLILQIFHPISKSDNPTVRAQFCPLPLSVPEAAMGVTLNAQQHSDSEYVKAIHRWEMTVCWGEHRVLLLAILIYWQGTRKPTAAQADGTLWFISN